jgi:hypothetical protein
MNLHIYTCYFICFRSLLGKLQTTQCLKQRGTIHVAIYWGMELGVSLENFPVWRGCILPQASIVAVAASHTPTFLDNYWLLHP